MAGFSVPIATVSALGIISVGAGLAVTAAGVLSATGAPAPATTVALGSVIVPVAGRLAVDGAGNISVPLGSAATFGVVKVDGVTITAAAGVITATAGAPPLATTTTAGVVIVPVSGNLAVDGSGNITVPLATGAVFGVVKVTAGNGLALASGVVSVSLGTNAAAGTVLVPTANGLSVTAGSVAIALGTNAAAGTVLVPTANGLSVTAGSVAMALATGAAAGTVIVPTSHGLSIAAGSIALALSTTTTAGTVIVPTSGNLAVDGSGNISVPLASSSVFGVVKVDGTTITAAAGVISATGISGALVLISTQTAAGSADLRWTGLGTTYNSYLLVLDGLIPATDSDDLRLQFGQGGTPTWLTASYYYAGNRNTSNSATTTGIGGEADSQIDITTGSLVSNAAGAGLSGAMFLANLQGAGNYPEVSSHVGLVNAGVAHVSNCQVSGYYLGDTTRITALKIFYPGGNIATGKASLFGIAP